MNVIIIARDPQENAGKTCLTRTKRDPNDRTRSFNPGRGVALIMASISVNVVMSRSISVTFLLSLGLLALGKLIVAEVCKYNV